MLLPNVSTGQARIKVKGSNHVFFDISNNNFGIIPGSDIDHDLGISNVSGLNPGACESVLDPVVTVFNVGLQPASSFNLSLTVDGGDPLLVSWTGTLASGESVDVPFCEGEACLALADGLHDAAVQLNLTSAEDENDLNDSFTTAFETNGGADVTWTILTDNYPGETTWTVSDASGATVWSGGPYGSSGTSYSETACLSTGCYTLTVNDSYGDGICCGYGQGSFELSSGGEVLVAGGEFGTTVSLDFCLEPRKLQGAPIQARRTTIRRPPWTTGLALLQSRVAPRPRRATTTPTRTWKMDRVNSQSSITPATEAAFQTTTATGCATSWKWQVAKMTRPAITTRQPQIRHVLLSRRGVQLRRLATLS